MTQNEDRLAEALGRALDIVDEKLMIIKELGLRVKSLEEEINILQEENRELKFKLYRETK